MEILCSFRLVLVGDEESFYSRLPKTVLNGVSFIFLSYRKTSGLHLISRDFNEKRTIKKSCKKSFENILN